MVVSALAILTGCQTPVDDERFFKQFWLFDGWEAFAINGVHQNELEASGAELIGALRGTTKGQMMLSGQPDVHIEMYGLGEEQGDLYGVWLEEGVVARLPLKWSGAPMTLPVYYIDREWLRVVKEKAEAVIQTDV